MKEGLVLAQESFSLRSPAAPESQDAQPIERWSETTLKDWLELKLRVLRMAQTQLDQASYQSHEELILAGAVVGLMYEDAGLQVLNVPVPREIQSDAQGRTLVQEVSRDVARPFVEKAKRAYRACTLNAQGGPSSMKSFASFCATRRLRMLESR